MVTVNNVEQGAYLVKRNSQYRYEYKTIYLPADLFDDMESEEAYDYAIQQAREQFTIYRIPAQYEVINSAEIGGEAMYLIRRTSNRQSA